MGEVDQLEHAHDQGETDGAEPHIAAGDEAVKVAWDAGTSPTAAAKAEKTRTIATSKSAGGDRRANRVAGKHRLPRRASGILNPRELYFTSTCSMVTCLPSLY